jgi:MFS family permease
MPGATARRALLPSLAQRADMRLEQVNATYSTMQNGAVLLGPALSGVLITVLGASNVLWLDAASFLISALLIGLGVPTTRAAPAASQHRYLADVREGLSFLVGNPLLRTIVLAAVIANFLLGPLFSVVLPVFVKNVYNDPTRLGILLATFGGGMVLGALGYGAVGYRLSRRILFIAGLCGMGAALLVTALLPPFGVMLLSMLVIGLMAAPANPLIQTLVQERTPADLLARVLGTLTALATAAIPLGVVLGGALVEAFGVRISLVVMAVGSLLVGISLLFSRALRGMERDA